MNPLFFILLGFIILPFLTSDVFAQTIVNVTSTEPCFLNYTAGVQMWENCGFRTDFIKATLAPWEWVTGGLFSMLVVIILVVMTYIKYHTVIYPIMIGIIFLPISWFLLPDQFFAFALLAAGIGIGSIILKGIIWNTRE